MEKREEAKFALQLEKKKKKQAKKDEKKRLKRQQQSTIQPPAKTSRSLSTLYSYSATSSSSPPPSRWNFTVDYNDHFETPLVAYQDILPVLQSIADSKDKLLRDLVVYDPYYCKGQMVKHLQSLGIDKGIKSIVMISTITPS